MDAHLGHLLEGALERRDDEDVLHAAGRWHTAAEQLDRMRRATGGLTALGVAPGTRVVVCMANDAAVSVAYGAIWRAGAVVTPVVFLLTEDELRHVLVDAEATAVLTSPELLPKVRAAAENVSSVQAIVLVGADDAPPPPGVTAWREVLSADPAERVARAGTDLAALMYTGGTTGRSKGVMLGHENLYACALACYERGIDDIEGAASLVALPLSHAYGLIVTLVSAFVHDATPSTLMRWFEPSAWLDLAEAHRVLRSGRAGDGRAAPAAAARGARPLRAADALLWLGPAAACAPRGVGATRGRLAVARGLRLHRVGVGDHVLHEHRPARRRGRSGDPRL